MTVSCVGMHLVTVRVASYGTHFGTWTLTVLVSATHLYVVTWQFSVFWTGFMTVTLQVTGVWTHSRTVLVHGTSTIVGQGTQHLTVLVFGHAGAHSHSHAL